SFYFSSRRRHTRFSRDWSSDVCSSDLVGGGDAVAAGDGLSGFDVGDDGCALPAVGGHAGGDLVALGGVVDVVAGRVVGAVVEVEAEGVDERRCLHSSIMHCIGESCKRPTVSPFRGSGGPLSCVWCQAVRGSWLRSTGTLRRSTGMRNPMAATGTGRACAPGAPGVPPRAVRLPRRSGRWRRRWCRHP